jgi:hypothetical protein
MSEKTYEVLAQFLDDGSRKKYVGGRTLAQAIDGCEYHAASHRERFDYIVIRAGHEWLATATREGERSFIFWISEETS